MSGGARYSFHDIPEALQPAVLQSRRSIDAHLGGTSGFAGRIFTYRAGEVICAKVPIARSITPQVAATRLLREMRLQRSFHYHQFVHWPFDFDFVLDTPVAWFRFWDGDLSSLIEDRRFSIEARLAMLAYLASALAHCHSRGLIAHQDLKPENIFVQDLTRRFLDLPAAQVWRIPKLADFGSANLAAEVGEFGGTNAYMAPEQWRREPLGQHTSVWSLGLIAYELLTFGQHPVGEATRPWRDRARGVFNRWQKSRMWLRWLREGGRPAGTTGDPSLDGLLVRCLSVAPEDRPSIAEFMQAILAALRCRSAQDGEHAAFRIFHADDGGRADHAWPYLDERFNMVVAAVAERFEDPSIVVAHALTEDEMRRVRGDDGGADAVSAIAS